MSRRFLGLIGAAAVILAVAVLLKLTPISIGGQAPTAGASAKAGEAPKTPWGEPDLQGIWTEDFQTPLQRSPQYATREFFTDEERAAQDKQRVAAPNGDDRVAPRGSEQDVSGAYN